MSETLSIRLDAEVKRRLDALAERTNRSKSFLAAEAIAAYVSSEEWQLAPSRYLVVPRGGGRGQPQRRRDPQSQV